MKKVKIVQNEYEWGEDPQLTGPRNYFRESLILNKIKKYKKRGTVLDAGCGSGSLSIRLAKQGYKVFSIDLSKKSLQFLKKEIVREGLDKRIRVQYKSIDCTLFKKESFDAIVCGEVLEHISLDEKVIGEFFRLLKKDGFVVITVPANQSLWDITDDISGHKRRYSKSELERKFKNKNFTIIESFYWGFPLNYFWHKYIFTPFLVNKLKNHQNITQSSSFISMIIKSHVVNYILSQVFVLDLVFRGKGNCLMLVAQKS